MCENTREEYRKSVFNSFYSLYSNTKYHILTRSYSWISVNLFLFIYCSFATKLWSNIFDIEIHSAIRMVSEKSVRNRRLLQYYINEDEKFEKLNILQCNTINVAQTRRFEKTDALLYWILLLPQSSADHICKSVKHKSIRYILVCERGWFGCRIKYNLWICKLNCAKFRSIKNTFVWMYIIDFTQKYCMHILLSTFIVNLYQ